MHFVRYLQVLGKILSPDVTELSAYFLNCRLKLSRTYTVSMAFYLNRQKAVRGHQVIINGNSLPFIPAPNYLGVKSDSPLTFP